MKMFKRFMAMFKTPVEPPVLRGRVTPHDPNVTGNGAMKAVAIPEAHVKYRVYRAKSDSWEDFKDAQIKSNEGLN